MLFRPTDYVWLFYVHWDGLPPQYVREGDCGAISPCCPALDQNVHSVPRTELPAAFATIFWVMMQLASMMVWFSLFPENQSMVAFTITLAPIFEFFVGIGIWKRVQVNKFFVDIKFVGKTIGTATVLAFLTPLRHFGTKSMHSAVLFIPTRNSSVFLQVLSWRWLRYCLDLGYARVEVDLEAGFAEIDKGTGLLVTAAQRHLYVLTAVSVSRQRIQLCPYGVDSSPSSCCRRLNSGMEAVRRNSDAQVIFCPLTPLGVAIGRYPSSKLFSTVVIPSLPSSDNLESSDSLSSDDGCVQ
ncbi:SKU5 similar 18 [Actinidia rufa]|uniref:SKU5 similar 18 n=1 Tax=Actinidia rufa TaxID=165716 RepID=A0A7J0GI04_9ERIC|nr:SKU5 similar 18 [Actinidia rufa]